MCDCCMEVTRIRFRQIFYSKRIILLQTLLLFVNLINDDTVQVTSMLIFSSSVYEAISAVIATLIPNVVYRFFC
jgi:hypothetical protein